MIKVEKKREGIAEIIPEEKIDYTNSHLLREELTALFDEGCGHVVIDFSNVKALDSSGLSQLVVYNKKLKEKGGKLDIVNVRHKKIQHLLDMVKLHKVINIS